MIASQNVFRVYDNRTDETLFMSIDKTDCIDYIGLNVRRHSKDWLHVWIEEIYSVRTGVHTK